MIKMRLAVIVILLFSLLLSTACLQRLSHGSGDFRDLYRDSLNRTPISSPDDLEECQEGSCWCMVCKNNTPLFKARQNLIGGYCYMEKNCNAERLGELNNKSLTPDVFPLQFMVGQGTTFGDFGTANTYCANRLSMAVQWLVGSNESPYLLPDAKRAMCFLSKSVIPVFVLYSNGTNINESRAYDIGRMLGTEGKNHYKGLLSNGSVGPVIIVTEINFNSSQAQEVVKQVRAINDACGNKRDQNEIYCFVAVAPKMNDFEALDTVMSELSGDKDLVDFVAYGIDGRYTHSCDGSRVMLEAYNFSRYSLYNHSKPTLIPYIMFDAGATSAGGCNWTERRVVDGYGSFFPFNIQSLLRRGVIGIAPYTFNSSAAPGLTNPLNCTACSVAGTDARMKAWFGGCQKYAASNRGVSDTTQILFGNASGTSCNAASQLSYVSGFNFIDRNILNPAMPTTVSQSDFAYSCDACLTDNLSKDITLHFKDGLKISRGAAFYKEEFCTIYPEANQWASARNLDPMYIRAIIVTESGFNPCETAKVCAAGYHISKEASPDNSGCFDNDINTEDECYSRAYDEMYIPEDTPGFGTECLQLNNDIVPLGQAPRWRYCAVGMMQSLEPPISFWPRAYRADGEDGQYVDVFNRAGLRHSADMDAARACNPTNFNPFKASDSLCIGTAKMEKMLRAAREWIRINKDKLNWEVDADVDKTNLFAAYIAANKYSGIWDMEGKFRVTTAEWQVHPRCHVDIKNGDCWALGFVESFTISNEYCASEAGEGDSRCVNGVPRKDPPGYCYGYTDFIKFVEDCEVPFLPVASDRGRVKMEAYLKFVTTCEASTCPEGKRYFQLADQPIPASGVPYMPNNLVQGQNP